MNNFSLPDNFRPAAQPNTFSLPVGFRPRPLPVVVPAPLAPSVAPLTTGQNLTTTQEAAAAPLTGIELTRIVQGGVNARVTLQQIAVLSGSTTIALLFQTTAGTVTPTPTFFGDIIINTSAAVTVQLPDSTLRPSGWAIGVVDIFGAPNVTIVPFGSQNIIGQPSLSLRTPHGGYALWPLSTGGWYEK